MSGADRGTLNFLLLPFYFLPLSHKL
jgi:hypothetical protein